MSSQNVNTPTSSDKKPVISIALITAVCLLGDAMLYIVLPVYWQTFGLTALWQVGILLSLNRFVRLPLNPIIGWFYHQFSKRTGIIIAVILAALTTSSYGFLHGFWILALARCLWGVAWSLLRLGGFLTVIDTATEQNRGELVGTYNGLWGLGQLGGMLTGGIVADLIGITPMTTCFALLALMSLPWVFRHVPAEKVVHEEHAESGRPRLMHIFRIPQVIIVMAAGFIVAMVFFGVYGSTLSRLTETLHGNDIHLWMVTLGAASLAGCLQALKWGWDPVLAPMIGKLTDGRMGRHRLFVIALSAAGIGFVLAASITNLWLWLVVIMMIQLFATALGTLNDTIASDTATRYGKVVTMTTYTVVLDVGAAVGPTLAYALGGWLGLPMLYILLGGFMIAFAGVWLVVGRRQTDVKQEAS
ncbi:MFS transporter [Tuberibacillus sp. Marseille-P3662]|uniref:MFS transporter n=1 Tax=Tuberibacillus sp. Marseille-P3662 TaxID=1965358 RepID=UPI001592DD98|nr:MFS transporter [Tuberibacillus sp. Marseille-P3662]